MSESFEGTISIGEPGKLASIELDGAKESLRLGCRSARDLPHGPLKFDELIALGVDMGDIQAGSIYIRQLKSAGGPLPGSPSMRTVFSFQGQETRLDIGAFSLKGDEATITLGGQGRAGSIQMNDPDGNLKTLIDGDGLKADSANIGGLTTKGIDVDGTITLNSYGVELKNTTEKGVSLGDNTIWLRGLGDNHHGLGWVDQWANTHIDGPVLFGNGGGALGTNPLGGEGEKIALKWDTDNNITIPGDIFLKQLQTNGGDCAEEFEVASVSACKPGTVLSIDDTETLAPCTTEYDKRVAGVVAGANGITPGIVLGKKIDESAGETSRVPIALAGKVCCMIDASHAPIELGDLLTTSSTPGHAMKAEDPVRAFGSVIGKALRPLKAGKGSIPILIALQ